jgi:hypothetical protein
MNKLIVLTFFVSLFFGSTLSQDEPNGYFQFPKNTYVKTEFDFKLDNVKKVKCEQNLYYGDSLIRRRMVSETKFDKSGDTIENTIYKWEPETQVLKYKINGNKRRNYIDGKLISTLKYNEKGSIVYKSILNGTNFTHYIRDSKDNIIEEFTTDKLNIFSKKTYHYVYQTFDDKNLLTSRTRKRDEQIVFKAIYEYNDQNQIVLIDYPIHNFGTPHKKFFLYDESGNLISKSSLKYSEKDTVEIYAYIHDYHKTYYEVTQGYQSKISNEWINGYFTAYDYKGDLLKHAENWFIREFTYYPDNKLKTTKYHHIVRRYVTNNYSYEYLENGKPFIETELQTEKISRLWFYKDEGEKVIEKKYENGLLMEKTSYNYNTDDYFMEKRKHFFEEKRNKTLVEKYEYTFYK